MSQKHYKIVHFYARRVEPTYSTLDGALAALNTRAENSSAETYSQLWEMSNDTDGEMIGFFENGIEANLEVSRIGKAKIIRK